MGLTILEVRRKRGDLGICMMQLFGIQYPQNKLKTKMYYANLFFKKTYFNSRNYIFRVKLRDFLYSNLACPLWTSWKS